MNATSETKRSGRVLAATMAATTGAITPPFLAGALGVQISDDLGGGPAALGLAVGAFFAVAGILAVPLGRTADHLGWARSFRWGALATVTSLAGVAVAARSWWLLGGLLAIGGIGHALVMPASNLALAREFGPGRGGLLFGLKQSASPTATLLGGIAVPVVALSIGWRWAFALAMVVPLAGVLLAPPLTATAPGRHGHAGAPRPTMVWLAMAGGSGAAVVTAMSSFLVVAGVSHGLGDAQAGRLLALCSVMSLLARILAGMVIDRIRRRRAVGFGPVAVLLAVGAVGLSTMASAATAAFVAGAVVAFTAGAGWPGLFHLAVVTRNAERPASASGTIQAGLSAGAALGPVLFGVTAARFSYPGAWVATAALSLVAAVTIAVAGHRDLRSVRATQDVGVTVRR